MGGGKTKNGTKLFLLVDFARLVVLNCFWKESSWELGRDKKTRRVGNCFYWFILQGPLAWSFSEKISDESREGKKNKKGRKLLLLVYFTRTAVLMLFLKRAHLGGGKGKKIRRVGNCFYWFILQNSLYWATFRNQPLLHARIQKTWAKFWRNTMTGLSKKASTLRVHN